MTDADAAPAEDLDPFAIVVTGEAFLQLQGRVHDLEGQQPAAGAPDDDPHARMDRHRAELEAIKRTINQLIRYVVDSAAPPPTELQPAPVATVEEDYR